MAQRGLCSRREADRLIEQGLVIVDGKPVDTLGIRVADSVKIELAVEARQQLQQKISIALNKPVGYVSGQPVDGYIPAVRLITSRSQSRLDASGLKLERTHFNGLAPAGRLDIDSQGLLVFTQDGRVARKLIGENSPLEKEYLVRVNCLATQQQLERLTHGIKLDGKALKPARVHQLNDEQLRFVLQEGKKRQIRRMCDAVGLKVKGLKRVRIGNLKLGKLKEGEWRFVAADEF